MPSGTNMLTQDAFAPNYDSNGSLGPEYGVLSRDRWSMFPWMFNGYTQLLARVHRFGSVDAQKQPIRPFVDNPRIIEYFSSTKGNIQDETAPWCSAFVNWCFARAGIAGTRDPAAKSWLGWPGGRRLSNIRPIIGSVVVFPRQGGGHVAMVWHTFPDGSIDVLGGNQGVQRARLGLHPWDFVPGIPTHVSIGHHKCNEALGYVWPNDYPLPNESDAKDLIQLADLTIPPELRPNPR